MSSYTIKDIISSTDRFKIYTLMCSPQNLNNKIGLIRSDKIPVINIGKQLAFYIEELDDYRFLNIDVYDYIKKIFEKNMTKINGSGNDVVAIYNLGILLEPSLELNAGQLLKEFSKSAALIIIWENQSELRDRLHWLTQQNIFLDFSETQIKKLHYAI